MEPKKLKRSIGLIGSAATSVGYVVGTSILILSFLIEDAFRKDRSLASAD